MRILPASPKCKHCNVAEAVYGDFCTKPCRYAYHAELLRKRLGGRKCRRCKINRADDGSTICSQCKSPQPTWRSPFEELRKDDSRRRRLIKDRGHRCEACQLTEWQQKLIPLELDHIDGNPENNAIDNLRLICPNCHAQTPNYKGKNIGKVHNSKRAAKLKRYGSYR